MYYFQERPRTLSQQPTTSPADPPTALEDCRKLCRCCVRLRALYLALGLKPIVQVVTVSPSALLVKFVGALPNLLVNRDQDGRFVRLRGECGLGSGLVRVLAGSFLFLDLVGMAIYPFSQLFSLPL